MRYIVLSVGFIVTITTVMFAGPKSPVDGIYGAGRMDKNRDFFQGNP